MTISKRKRTCVCFLSLSLHSVLKAFSLPLLLKVRMVSRRLSKAGLVFHPRARHVGPNSVPPSTATYGSLADLRIRTFGGPYSLFLLADPTLWSSGPKGGPDPSGGRPSGSLFGRPLLSSSGRARRAGGIERSGRQKKLPFACPGRLVRLEQRERACNVPGDGGRARQKDS